jgi:hypothetical protein
MAADAAPRALFELELTDGPATRLHQKALGRIESRYPWDVLDPARYPAALVERARVGWTQNAFNEYCAVGAMGELLVALVQARAPLDFWSAVSRFALEEVRHVELCSRVAMRLGGGAPVAFSPADVVPEVDPSLSPAERAAELAVRVLCVGEMLSLPLLRGCMKSATNRLTKAVLRTIVAEEAPHARLGWLYLDWAAPALGQAERARLGRAAKDTIDHYAELWDRLTSRAEDGLTSEGFRLDDIRELGWMESSAYVALARATVASEIVPRLATYGIAVTHAGKVPAGPKE